LAGPNAGERVRRAVERAATVGNECARAMALGRDALAAGDELLARRVVAGDAAIDRACAALEDDVLSILALSGPLAGDMRRAVAVFKAISDFERAGDYAVHAARAVRAGTGAPRDIVKMAAEASAMLADAGAALAEEDAERARAVVARDPDVDRLCARIRRRLDQRDEGVDAEAARWLLTSRALERAADHAVSIAQWAIYAAVGERPAVDAP
jgi:phosphate transport system protein